MIFGRFFYLMACEHDTTSKYRKMKTKYVVDSAVAPIEGDGASPHNILVKV